MAHFVIVPKLDPAFPAAIVIQTATFIINWLLRSRKRIVSKIIIFYTHPPALIEINRKIGDELLHKSI